MSTPKCQRCNIHQSWYQVNVNGQYERRCVSCLTPEQKKQIDEARQQAAEAAASEGEGE